MGLKEDAARPVSKPKGKAADDGADGGDDGEGGPRIPRIDETDIAGNEKLYRQWSELRNAGVPTLSDVAARRQALDNIDAEIREVVGACGELLREVYGRTAAILAEFGLVPRKAGRRGKR